ncbi:cullin protein 1 [Nannochloropsis oceanica]
MAGAPPPNPVTIEEGWEKEILPKAILPLEKILNEGLQDRQKRDLFGPREYVHIYTICYNMCTQRNPFNWSEQLYAKHNETISNYLTQTVLPSLRDHHSEFLLVEVKRRWENHKIMNEWMRKFFMYLDRYYVKHNSLPSLHVSGIKFFKEQVYDVVKGDVVRAMLAMINLEREGQVIERALMRSCVEIFETMGDQKECYKEDLEETLLSDTREYYARKSQEWIETDSTPAYLLKAEAALDEERARVFNYLNGETEDKLLKVVMEELLEKQETTLLEREGSGWMLNDLAVGVDHQKEFLEHLKSKSSSAGAASAGVSPLGPGSKMAPEDFSVKVLTTGYWPSYQQMDVRLPDEMLRCTQAFRAWYDLKNQRRRLAWQHALGSATLRAKFGAKTYDLQTNTLQAVLLLSFQSEGESLDFSTLKERLNVPVEQMKPLLHSLSCGKYKVLRKSPASDKIKETDSFAVHTGFSCPQRVIRIPMATIEESHNPNRVEEDRSIAIEAAIVRIMKARKVLTHQQLTSEVLSQLAFFRPSPKVVKQRIHALIDREYLERDENPNQYKYLA